MMGPINQTSVNDVSALVALAMAIGGKHAEVLAEIREQMQLAVDTIDTAGKIKAGLNAELADIEQTRAKLDESIAAHAAEREAHEVDFNARMQAASQAKATINDLHNKLDQREAAMNERERDLNVREEHLTAKQIEAQELIEANAKLRQKLEQMNLTLKSLEV